MQVENVALVQHGDPIVLVGFLDLEQLLVLNMKPNIIHVVKIKLRELNSSFFFKL